ncbi:MAG: PHP domain-containing protein [Spirochaetales bacterium]|nr:PHP domain-containing protein [Spirochaetales bacterium]
MVDLHSHSTESDGALSPRELMFAAREAGLSAIALTDHDTLAGLEEAEAAAKEAGLRFIPGIEMDIAYRGGEFHLLGLGIYGWRESGLAQTLALLQADRTRRNKTILAAMNADGVSADYAEVEAFAGGDIVGRPHFARLLVARGRVRDTEEAFQRYLKPGMPYYARRSGLCAEEAAALIHEAGGRAVSAHPLSLRLGWSAFEEKLAALKAGGIDGIEAWHSNAQKSECRRFEVIARELGMLTSAGSDFHGGHLPGRKLGRVCEGTIPIDDCFARPFLQETGYSPANA